MEGERLTRWGIERIDPGPSHEFTVKQAFHGPEVKRPYRAVKIKNANLQRSGRLWEYTCRCPPQRTRYPITERDPTPMPTAFAVEATYCVIFVRCDGAKIVMRTLEKLVVVWVQIGLAGV